MGGTGGVWHMVFLPAVFGITVDRRWRLFSMMKPTMPVGWHLRCFNHTVISNIPTRRLTRTGLSLFVITITERITADELRVEAKEKLGDKVHVATFVVSNQIWLSFLIAPDDCGTVKIGHLITGMALQSSCETVANIGWEDPVRPEASAHL